jgi:hypothetical protein
LTDLQKAWLYGTLQSWTNWFGAMMVALPDILPLVLPNIQALTDETTYKRIVQIAGVIVILLRYKTKTSILVKGTQAVTDAKDGKESGTTP